MSIYCPHLKQRQCQVATTLALLPVRPTKEQCYECSNHLTLPQRINGVTCSMAYRAQKDAGLEVDPKLSQCIRTEQTYSEEVLRFLRKKWKDLHTFKIVPWNKGYAETFYENWLNDLPTFGCQSCASHWQKITERWPINFTSHFAYFCSTHYAHNIVNKRIYKSWFPLEDSIVYWSTVFFNEHFEMLFDYDPQMRVQNKAYRHR